MYGNFILLHNKAGDVTVQTVSPAVVSKLRGLNFLMMYAGKA